MNPPLVKTTATAPTSARVGVARPADARNPRRATSIIRYFVISRPLRFPSGLRAAVISPLLSCLGRGLRCFVCIPIAAGDGPHAPSDVFVCFVGQIRERHPHRPVRRFKSATVQQHDPVCLGQPERKIERMDVLLRYSTASSPMFLRAQNSKSTRP